MREPHRQLRDQTGQPQGMGSYKQTDPPVFMVEMSPLKVKVKKMAGNLDTEREFTIGLNYLETVIDCDQYLCLF